MNHKNDNIKTRNIKIRTRLIMVFFFLSVTPVIIISLISYYMSNKAIIGKIENYSTQVMKEVSTNLTAHLTRFEGLCEELEMSEEIQKGLLKYNTASSIEKYAIEDKISLKSIEKMRLSSFGTSSEIVSINIITNKNTIIGVGQNYYKANQLIKVANSLTSSKYQYSYNLINDLNGNYNIAIKKLIKNHITGEKMGTIILTFKENYISNFCEELDMKGNADVFTIDSAGTIIGSNNHLKIPINNKYLETALIDEIINFIETGKFSFSVYSNGEKRILVYNSVANCDWFIVSSIPYSYLHEESKYILWSIISIGLLNTIIMSFLIIFVINIYVKEPLNEISQGSRYLADGDLRITFNDKSKDEIGQMNTDLNNFLKKLVEIIDNASEIKLNVNQTADHLSSGNKVLLDKITNQSASLQEITATMEDITENVSNNFIKIKEVYSTAKDTEHKVGSMELSSNKLNNSIIEIEKSSQSIEEIIKFVENIAFQTKLLAINSTIEAARAGDAGKNFAEIAVEIRELSRISANSVKDIKEKIRENERNITQGKQAITETLDTIQKVTFKIKELYGFMAEISLEPEEEEESIIQIKNTLNDIANITVHISDTAQDVSEIADFLKKETKYLSDTLSFFKLK